MLRSIWKTAAFAAALVVAGPAMAQEDGAAKVLKAMSDYLAGQKAITAVYDHELEIITPALEKITFASSGELQMVRPDKLKASRTGGYADVELYFDGKSLTVYGKNIQRFVKIDAGGTINQLVEAIHARGISMPFADLILSDPYSVLSQNITEAKHIGRGVVGGVECEHLAFRTDEVDWQIWVQVGAQPIPRKIIINSKTIAGSPHYALLIRDWKTGTAPEPKAFEFAPPAGAAVAGIEILREIDELPAPAGAKGQ
jgi:hypothetical protein